MVSRLEEEGHELTALLLPHEPGKGLGATTVVRGDITEPESLRGLMEGLDAVVHLAGAVGYGQEWSVCRKLNVEGTRNVAEEAKRTGIPGDKRPERGVSPRPRNVCFRDADYRE